MQNGIRMKTRLLAPVLAVLVIGGALGAYFYWRSNETVAPVAVAPSASGGPLVREEIHHVLEPAAQAPVLPVLGQSDDFTFGAIRDVLNNKALAGLIIPKDLIRNIVATIDNLPGRRVAPAQFPVQRPIGKFGVTRSGDALVMDPADAARYTRYVQLAQSADPEKLVALYVRLYPLFQQAYADLGYPRKYFNDRVMQAVDDLLATPEAPSPVKLVQPLVYYKFADPEFENRSVGQRILMRMSPTDALMLKAQLASIREQLLLHMHDEKVVTPPS